MALATPLLVPMIEEGFFNNKISRAVIDSYLSRPKLKKIDALILGCTHYPLIKKEIETIYKGKVPFIDSADEVAEYVYHFLRRITYSILRARNPCIVFMFPIIPMLLRRTPITFSTRRSSWKKPESGNKVIFSFHY